jgi:protein phosphatase
VAFIFDCYAVSHIGNHRRNNEDNFYIGELISPEEQSLMSQEEDKSISKNITADGTMNRIFAVSDGMGGHEFGEVASYIAVSALDEFTAGQKARSSRRKKEKYEYIQAFQEMIVQANQRVNEFATDMGEHGNMGATLSGMIFFSDEAAPFNIGDSVTFVFERNRLHKLTRDDNEISMFDGAAPQKLKADGKRLTKYLGLPQSSSALTATISPPAPLKLGQIYLIASDGLTDSLSEDKISRIVEENDDNITKAANELLEASLCEDSAGLDNVTVVLIKITK